MLSGRMWKVLLCINLWALVSLALSAAPLGELRRVKYEKDHTAVYRLFLRGKPTALTLRSSGMGGPVLEVRQGSKGLVYGTVTNIESGAYLVTITHGFVQHRNIFLPKKGHSAKMHHGERVLFVPVPSGIWAEAGHAFLYERGRLRDVGLATRAHLETDGTVAGWFLADESGKPYTGLVSGDGTRLYRRYFEWKGGRRRDKGRRPAEDLHG